MKPQKVADVMKAAGIEPGDSFAAAVYLIVTDAGISCVASPVAVDSIIVSPLEIEPEPESLESMKQSLANAFAQQLREAGNALMNGSGLFGDTVKATVEDTGDGTLIDANLKSIGINKGSLH